MISQKVLRVENGSMIMLPGVSAPSTPTRKTATTKRNSSPSKAKPVSAPSLLPFLTSKPTKVVRPSTPTSDVPPPLLPLSDPLSPGLPFSQTRNSCSIPSDQAPPTFLSESIFHMSPDDEPTYTVEAMTLHQTQLLLKAAAASPTVPAFNDDVEELTNRMDLTDFVVQKARKAGIFSSVFTPAPSVNDLYREACRGSMCDRDHHFQQIISSYFPIDYCPRAPAVHEIGLPPLPKGDLRFTLVLDLDETCYHGTDTRPSDLSVIEVPVLTQPVDTSGMGIRCVRVGNNPFFALRPGVTEFLQWASKEFEVVAYSAAHEMWVECGLAALDPRREFFSHVRHREHCSPYVNARGRYEEMRFSKEAGMLDRDMNRVICVDDRPHYFAHSIQNLIPCPGFSVDGYYDCEYDTFFAKLRDILTPLALSSRINGSVETAIQVVEQWTNISQLLKDSITQNYGSIEKVPNQLLACQIQSTTF